ncbi:MAG TPA: alpha/beta hydrolase [Bradyrhizobium sp.]|uniref:alpha/beta hydrolase n=1 Tax=Bradyrhizobium sp. TaxID=376 RepID=UPI002BF2A0A6|nr:alpha/beta hydrolase [Bradyrhizobium sp.]HLZ00824.1 alpha/beta hydrolase [Bradyrhizobium sp.]
MATNTLALSRSGSESGSTTDRSASRDVGGATRPIARDDVSAWYDGGERIPYDPTRRAIGGREGALRVFVRTEGDTSHAVSFLPGYPDGSIGWAKVLPHLPAASVMPKLFLDYVGMGDSDKPWDYAYSTAERTDLIEAIWRDLNVRSTTLVAFDFSSLVVLEHLRRRLERAARGESEGGPEIRGVFIFNGGLFTDGHSHPWFTTPVLRRLPERARKRLGRSFTLFKLTTRVMWSKRYALTDAEVRTVLDALNRHDGAFYLGAAAGFAADHRAQGERLDFGRLFMAWREHFPFLVGGSDDDAFEHRQVDLAEQRLTRFGLAIARLPGGHLTTCEEPRALAELIARFERDNAR